MTIRILLVDDELHWIDFARQDLDTVEIVVAPDLETALTELEADRFDLVIASSRRLDLLEVIAEKYSDKKVVVTTMERVMQPRGAGSRRAEAYVEKDHPDELVKMVRQALAT
jgi:DNA-binding NarL/FixJ family response regulator